MRLLVAATLDALAVSSHGSETADPYSVAFASGAPPVYAIHP